MEYPIDKKPLLTILALLVLANAAVAQKILSYQDSNFIYKITLDSTLSGDSANYDCSIKSFSIIRQSDNKLIQTIEAPDNSFFRDLAKDQLFIIEDVNFDGFNDLGIIQFIPAAPNIPYYYWTYNSNTKQFQRDTTLEEITSPEFHHDKKIITSFWRANCCDHGTSTYKYINGKLVLIEEEEVALAPKDDKKYIRTVKKRVNGKMILVKKVIEKVEGDKN
jgi:hypothetical protein